MSKSLILYDGICGLCNRFNTFVLKRDRDDQFYFASLQSQVARSLLNKYGKDPGDLNTLYVVTEYGSREERIWSRSTAAIRILSKLGGGWKAVSRIMALFPAPLRDVGYRLLAASRYSIFGKYETCLIPDKKWRSKFLDVL